jgi:hypothetical protein
MTGVFPVSELIVSKKKFSFCSFLKIFLLSHSGYLFSYFKKRIGVDDEK